MTVFVRVMVVDADGGPVVGDAGMQLGARHPGSTKPLPGQSVGTSDIYPDSQGLVHPGKAGMSLFVKGARMPAHLTKACTGEPGQLAKFEIADDPFPTKELTLQVTNPARGHGVMSPTAPMQLTAYQGALAHTRPQWRKI